MLWDFESIKEVRFDVIKYGIVSLYADHCAEEKKKDVNITAHHDLNEVGNVNELDDLDHEKDVDSECSTDEKLLSGDDIESNYDEELEEIREKKRMLKEGNIDPLRDGNLTGMYISNGTNNVTVEQVGEEPQERQERQRELQGMMIFLGKCLNGGILCSMSMSMKCWEIYFLSLMIIQILDVTR